jgi:O-antigen/teichoic acid export membrane protein
VQKEVRTKFLAGAIWMIGWRWSARFIGLISVLILARILTPEDFGVVAIATLSANFLEMLTVTGLGLALIRHENLEPAHLNTGWTIRILQNCAVALLMIPATHFAAGYFNEPRIIPIMYLLAALLVFSGFSNIGTIYFQRDLDFHKEFILGLAQKLVAFAVTVTAAVTLRNYWALVLGILAGRLTAFVLSYTMHSYRPRFSLSKFQELWGFSQWILAANVIRFLNLRADQFAVGGALGTTAMGNYNVSYSLATMPTSELGIPLERSLFPNFSAIAHDKYLLKNAFMRALATSLLIIPVIGVGLACVAEQFILVVMSEKWLHIVPLFEWLAILGVLWTSWTFVRPLYMAIGEPRMLTIFEIVLATFTIPACFLAAYFSDVILVCMARVATMVVIIPFAYNRLMRQLDISTAELLAGVWRPACAIVVMALVLDTIQLPSSMPVLLDLLISVGVGAIAYVLSLTMLCVCHGYRDTLEFEIASNLSVRLTRIVFPR